ncbi:MULTISPECIES: PP2C family serine/threonine-protein phosphatase [unclassified Frankia]|uniref:PP2C family protein-serine/threonine phosphatase n=1 Tax=unclassified Frankia TaxID=2632575 RepID=UPI001EF41CC1|nr:MULTISPECIES: PP2C family serine/threonine-protein phosphatase [unclassified Frankia]
MSLRLHYAVRSDVGHVREGNEDSAYAGARLVAVADGMGGHAAGEVASSTVISQLAGLDEDASASDILDALADSVDQANAALRAMSSEDGSLEGMGTTVTALLLSGSSLGVLHVGDSRAYLLRDGALSQVTHDHTLVQDLVDQGRITAEQADTHPQRSLLMRALDGRDVDPDLFIQNAVIDDRYLLCTDGLSGVVTEVTIHEALQLTSPQEVVDRLVELALKGGGPDNITVVVADVVEDGHEDDYRPLIAGAAAEKRIVPGAAAARTGPNPQFPDQDSPAAKGARIGRHGTHRRDPEPDDVPDDVSARRYLPRPLLAGLCAVVLLGAAALGAWFYIHRQYYVGVDNQQVAIFEGVDGNFIGISLHTFKEPAQPAIALTELKPIARDTVKRGYQVGSLGEARDFIKTLREQMMSAIADPAPNSTAPAVTASAAPTPTAGAGSTGGAEPVGSPQTGSGSVSAQLLCGTTSLASCASSLATPG